MKEKWCVEFARKAHGAKKVIYVQRSKKIQCIVLRIETTKFEWKESPETISLDVKELYLFEEWTKSLELEQN